MKHVYARIFNHDHIPRMPNGFLRVFIRQGRERSTIVNVGNMRTTTIPTKDIFYLTPEYESDRETDIAWLEEMLKYITGKGQHHNRHIQSLRLDIMQAINRGSLDYVPDSTTH